MSITFQPEAIKTGETSLPKTHPVSASNIERVAGAIEKGNALSVVIDGKTEQIYLNSLSQNERKEIAQELRELRKADLSELAKKLGVTEVQLQKSITEDIVRRCLLQKVSQEENSATCAVASIELRLIKENPSAYLKMIRELASHGETNALSGERIKRFSGNLATDLDLSKGEIGISGRIFQLSAMSHVYEKTGFSLSYDSNQEFEVGVRNKGVKISNSLHAVGEIDQVRGLYDSQLISLSGTILGNHAGGQYIVSDDGSLSPQIEKIISTAGSVNKVVSLNLGTGSAHTTHAVLLSEIKEIDGVRCAVFNDSYIRSSNGNLDEMKKLLPDGAHLISDGSWAIPVTSLINRANPGHSMLRMIEVDNLGSLSSKIDHSASYASTYQDGEKRVGIVNSLPSYILFEAKQELRKEKKKYLDSDQIGYIA